MKISVKISTCILVLVMLLSVFSGCNNKTNRVIDTNKPEEQAPLFTERTAPSIEKAEEVTPTAEKFSVSHAFSDNMVLQRDDYIRIWGTAKNQDGKTVCAEFKGLKGSATITDGEWLITLDGTLEASAEKGNTLRVYSATKEVEFEDVLVGDVYMVIGQSNAAYVVANFLEDSRDDKEAHSVFSAKDISNDDNIRVIRNVMGDPTVGKDITSVLSTDVRHNRGWQMPKTVANGTSAIGYFFAKQLIEKTNNEIPVGIIECSAAGCVMAAFMSPEAAEACGVDSYDEYSGAYMAESAIGPQQSRVVYNQYINPFMKFTISGLIWYQGESDCTGALPKAYPGNYTTLINDYRSKINQNYHDFPVFIIELPTEYTQPADFTGGTWAYMDVGSVRSYMGMIPSMLPNSFISASSDLWKNTEYWNSLHPYCKWPMATRTVDIVLPILYKDYVNKDDNSGNIEYTASPTYSWYERASNTDITLHFNFTGDGLKVDGDKAAGFEILVGDSWIEPQEVTISGDTVKIKSSSEFTAVRYDAVTTYSYPETVNVSSSSGVPMAAFCWDADLQK